MQLPYNSKRYFEYAGRREEASGLGTIFIAPISPFSRTRSLSLSLRRPRRHPPPSVPLPLLPRNFTCTTAAADAAKERSVVQGAPAAAAAHVALSPPFWPARARPPRPGQQTLQMGQKDLTERPR